MWVSVYRVPPPPNKVISVRHGASICFAAYSKILDQWYLCANGTEEEIEPPALWFCTDEQMSISSASNEAPKMNMPMRRSKKVRQLELFSLPNIRPNS